MISFRFFFGGGVYFQCFSGLILEWFWNKVGKTLETNQKKRRLFQKKVKSFKFPSQMSTKRAFSNLSIMSCHFVERSLQGPLELIFRLKIATF